MTLVNQEPETLKGMVEHCAGFMNQLTAWEQRFIDSISEQLVRNQILSQAQIDSLERVCCKLP